MSKLDIFGSKKAWPLRAAFLVFWLMIFAFGGMAQGKISTVTTNDQATFLPLSAESTLAAKAAKDFLKEESVPLLIVAVNKSDEKISPESFAQVRTEAHKLGDLKVTGSQTLADLSEGAIVTIPNPKQDAVLLPVLLDKTKVSQLNDAGKMKLGEVVNNLRKHFEITGNDLSLDFYVTGPAGIASDIGSAFAGIDLTLLLVALILVFVILLVVYRSVLLPLAVLLTAITALCGAVLVVYQLAKADVLTLNGQTQGILAILVVGATTDYCLLLIARYREELGARELPREAIGAAIRGTWEPIVASGGTVIAGLLTLLLSDLSSTSSLGPIASIGIVFAMLAALTLLPGVLLLPGKRARIMFWPAKIKHSASSTVIAERTVADADSVVAANHPFWHKISVFVSRHGRAVWIGSLVFLLVFAAFAPSFKASGVSAFDTFMHKTESAEGFKLLEKKFELGSSQPTTVVVKEDQYKEAIERISAIEGVSAVVPQSDTPTQPGRPAPPNLVPKVVDGRVLLNVTTLMPAEDAGASVVVEKIRTEVRGIDAGALVGGPAAQTLDTQTTARGDFAKIVPVVLVVILIMLILLLRAVVAPVLILVANIVSFASAMGLCALLFNHVFGFPGADASVPIYAFVFLVALGIDYTIFLMSRVREESRRYGTEVGVRHGVAVTGGVITSAGVVLAATFAALAVVSLLFMVQLAVIVALGIVIDTFIVRSLLVPGVVLEFGDRVWWPSKLNERAKGNMQ
ncbi:RND superfamily putative drug exporter [Arcanobacterium pluranimalium]|uniref:MMPL family transporter n=1 Tax=Arcanobacterium pluranimalium TaxID=108028 RepID=UPI001956ADA2|nr:MMPL family transporter [Arcanobacterium pluranimalium]MBM7824763.1 RND superfamily putative drug exporter [Arcanobacterium pluranimalium]